jgi:DtxR family transcriptional regulator, Mn-dependent transcriptional regulator
MLTSTVEDYLKALFRLGGAGRIVQIGHIAEAVGVTAGSVTTMMKHLQASGLAHYMPRRGVRLSEPGRLAAMRVIRRHRLVELFLVDVLGMDMAEVHPEAEILEHALSERLTDLIDQHLGRPAYDPHGRPIPDASGVIRETSLKPLIEQTEGGRYHLMRLTRQDQAFIDWLASFGIEVGGDVGLAKHDLITGIVTLETAGGRRIQIGESAAAALLVE